MHSFEPAKEARPTPETAFAAADGTLKTIADFRGKIVLLNFWATWCAPCVREMPSLRRLQERLGGRDFTVLALSADRAGWSKIAPFIEQYRLAGLPIYHDVKMATTFAAGARGLPTTLLIDRDGREIGRLTGPAEWDSNEAIALIRHYLGRDAGR